MKALPRGVLSLYFKGLIRFSKSGVLYPRPLNGFAPSLFIQIGAPNLKPWQVLTFRRSMIAPPAKPGCHAMAGL